MLEILKEENTIGEIGSREDISRTQLQNWKKEFIENASRIFAQTKVEHDVRQLVREKEEREHELMAKVGQLTIENDWLKKNLPQLTELTEIRDLVRSTDKLSVTRQCELLDINRTSFYRIPKEPDVEALPLRCIKNNGCPNIVVVKEMR